MAICALPQELTMATLTQGCISRMYRDEKVKLPVVQILEMSLAKSADSSAPKRVK